MSRRKVYWSDLLPELLSQIATRLETRPDILNFRGVCKDWRRSVSLTLLSNKNVLSLFLPHKLSINNSSSLFKLENYRNEFKVNSVIIVATSIFKIKPAFNAPMLPHWVVTVEEVNPGELCLRKPFSRSAVVDKPDWFPKVLDLGRFEVEEMVKAYSLRFDKTPKYMEDFFSFEENHKVILMVDSECKTVATIDDYIAIVLYDVGALSSIRLKDEIEKQLVANKVRKFDDIVMFNGTVYVIDRYGKLYLIDNGCSDRLKLVNVVETQLKSGNHKRSRLVESCGELYLIRKCLVNRPALEIKCNGIRVYKLNQESMSWDELESIGDDRILFVTPDSCFFGRTSDFYGWKGNCVVFHTKTSLPPYFDPPSYDSDQDYYNERSMDLRDTEVFHLEDCKFESIQYNAPYFGVFWPPPKWVSSDTA